MGKVAGLWILFTCGGEDEQGRAGTGRSHSWREGEKEWWRDIKRIREKRGALATLRKWRESEREGLAHSRRERRECVCV